MVLEFDAVAGREKKRDETGVRGITLSTDITETLAQMTEGGPLRMGPYLADFSQRGRTNANETLTPVPHCPEIRAHVLGCNRDQGEGVRGLRAHPHFRRYQAGSLLTPLCQPFFLLN